MHEWTAERRPTAPQQPTMIHAVNKHTAAIVKQSNRKEQQQAK